ncbi:MAG: histidine--tRNA ligase [Lachnospiraceae bacterium]|nr:histidine--tRNA ligase [Lachnospiraceae bacterium]
MSDVKVKPGILSGFMELLPGKQKIFDNMQATLREVFSSYGFYGLDTPVLERTEILLAKGGGETEKQVYRFDRGDTDITMRYDLTVPLARYVAEHYSDLSFPFKRYQIGKVYRGERSQKGRFREFYQCDIDIIGDGKLSVLNEAECPAVMAEALTALGIPDFKIRINNRKLLNGLFEIYGVQDKKTEILRAVDKIEKIGREKVIEELKENGLAEENAADILDTVTFGKSNAETEEMLSSFAGKSALFDEGVSDLKRVMDAMRSLGVKEENFGYDLSIARGLDYYTGSVYETQFTPDPSIGSICSGGRYDDLAGYFTDRPLPGVGMSIGLTRLFYILNEKEYFKDEAGSAAEVLFIPMTDDMDKALSFSAQLRSAGVRVQTYYEDKKFKKKMDYANKLGIPFVALLGEDEIKEGKISLKDMRSGEQEMLDIKEAAARIKA